MGTEKKLAAGQRFGSWKLVGQAPLGKGGNGTVWEAINEVGTTGAIKFLHRHHFGTKRHDRFKDEIAFLRAEAGRAGVLPLLDANLPSDGTADRPWLVTPLATPFTKLPFAGRGSLSNLVDRLACVARTLARLHSENKFHRDIKPDNLLELDGVAMIGDFGLVDFPGKEPLTEAAEIMGPLFYVAPEMMTDAADKPAGPADVYSLAKTLWVLASGYAYPLPGEQRAENVQLRLSTYCPHNRATILDRLVDRATRHDPAQRPSAREFADELAAWTAGPQSAGVTVDTEALSKEYSGVFQSANAAARRRRDFLLDAQGVLNSFSGLLQRIARDTINVTGIEPRLGPCFDLPARLRFIESRGTAQVLERWTQQVETIGGDHIHMVRLQSIAHVEALSDEHIRILVVHIVRYEVGKARTVASLDVIGAKEAIDAWGSAQLQNDEQDLHTAFLASLGDGIRAFGEQMKIV